MKAPPFNAAANQVDKIYTDHHVDLELIIRNYTMTAKDIRYTLHLPDGWSASKAEGTVHTAGYSGTGPHYDRRVTETITVYYPSGTEIGTYDLRLVTSDGTTEREHHFQVEITELFNLLYNGSMEIDEDGDGIPDLWTPVGAAAIEMIEGTSEEPAPIGKTYVKIAGTNAPDAPPIHIKQEGTRQGVHWLLIDPNKKYELSFWAKVESGAVSVETGEARGLNYEWLGSNAYMKVTAEENGNEWKHYRLEFFPKPNAGRFKMQFNIESEPGLETVFYLDGVILRELELTPEENLIRNGNFEEDGGWIKVAKGTGSFDAFRAWEDQYGGLYSYQISGTAGGSYVAQEWIPIEPGGKYEVEFYARVKSGAMAATAVMRTSGSEELVFAPGPEVTVNEEWTKYAYSFTAPKDAAQVSLRFVLKDGAAAILNLDNVVLRYVPSEPSFRPWLPAEPADAAAVTRLNEEDVMNQFAEAEEDAAGRKIVAVRIPAEEDAAEYTVEFSANLLAAMGENHLLAINTAEGSIVLPGNMFADELPEQAVIRITIGRAEAEEFRSEAIGNRPAIRVMVTVNGESAGWDNPGASVIISIPYEPGDGEREDLLSVHRIGPDGRPMAAPNARYDRASGRIVFKVSRLDPEECFAIAYAEPSFDDLEQHEWAREFIEAIAAKGILSGGSGHRFHPGAAITRDEFLAAVVRALGLTAQAGGSFSDVSENNPYYQEIGIAKALGITNGIGNDLFNSGAPIERQDMILLVIRTMAKAGIILEEASGDVLLAFSDHGGIREDARAAMATGVRNGILQGSNQRLHPAQALTRSEAAAVIYRMIHLLSFPEF